MNQKGKKDKGKRGELEAASTLNNLFPDINARRGRYPEPDVVHDYKGVHVEVKRTEAMRVYDFVEQAMNDAKENEVPVVLLRKNYKPWLAIIPLDRLPLDRLRNE